MKYILRINVLKVRFRSVANMTFTEQPRKFCCSVNKCEKLKRHNIPQAVYFVFPDQREVFQEPKYPLQTPKLHAVKERIRIELNNKVLGGKNNSCNIVIQRSLPHITLKRIQSLHFHRNMKSFLMMMIMKQRMMMTMMKNCLLNFDTLEVLTIGKK